MIDQVKAALAGSYEIIREIGVGGSSRVFLARDLKHDRQVAIKVLKPEIASSVGRDRFLKEIRTTASLTHPRILPLLDSGESSGLVYFVTPFFGESLARRMEKSGPLPFEEIRQLVIQIAEALDYAHRNNVVHRDIKPGNILLSDGGAIVADFGIAQALDRAGGEALTVTGFLIGTRAYMSPEQVQGRWLDARSDLYSLGCVILETLTGAPPDDDATTQATRERVAESPKELAKLRPGIPSSLATTVHRLLAPAPEDRPPSGKAVLQVLAPSGDVSPKQVAGMPRAPWLLAGAAVILVAAVFALLPISPLRHKPAPTATKDAVAVMPFQVEGPKQLDYLSEGMVDLLSTALDGAGDFRTIDPRALLSRVPAKSSSVMDKDAASARARELGASYFILGSALSLGDDVQLEASLYKSGPSPREVAHESVNGSPDAIPLLVNQLAMKVLAAREVVPSQRLERAAATMTSSLPALKAYLAGKRADRALLPAAAAEAYKEAIREDSTFALAWYELSWALWSGGSGKYEEAVRAADRAAALGTSLPEQDRLLLQGSRAMFRGDATTAEESFNQVVAGHPDDVDAWGGLAYTYLIYNSLRGRSVVEARKPFEMVVQLAPEDRGAFGSLIRTCTIAQDSLAVDTLTRTYLARFPMLDIDWLLGAPLAWDILLLRFQWFHDKMALARYLEGLQKADPTLVMEELFNANMTRDSVLIPRLRAALGRSYVSPEQEVNLRLASALGDCRNGQWPAASEEFTKAEAANPIVSQAYHALLACAVPTVAPRSELAKLRTQVLAWEDPAMRRYVPDSTSTFYQFEGPLPPVREFLLGMLNARLGDEPEALRYAKLLEERSPSELNNAWVRYHGFGIQAYIAWRHGKWQQALAYLEKEPIPSRPGERWGFKSLSDERYLLAETLFALGRKEEAAGWYSSLGQILLFDLPYEAPAELRLGQIYESFGQPERAMKSYSECLSLWKNADPDCDPLKKEAESGYARVAALAARVPRSEAGGTRN
jgi:tetratricopeptide (TPR) repeat protein